MRRGYLCKPHTPTPRRSEHPQIGWVADGAVYGRGSPLAVAASERASHRQGCGRCGTGA